MVRSREGVTAGASLTSVTSIVTIAGAESAAVAPTSEATYEKVAYFAPFSWAPGAKYTDDPASVYGTAVMACPPWLVYRPPFAGRSVILYWTPVAVASVKYALSSTVAPWSSSTTTTGNEMGQVEVVRAGRFRPAAPRVPSYAALASLRSVLPSPSLKR